MEIILLCWMPGQKTPIHDHSQSDCWVRVLSGSIEESIFDPAGFIDESLIKLPSRKKQLKKGESSFINNNLGLHTLENTTSEKAITVHLYTPPIMSCLSYDSSEKEKKERSLFYDSIYGKIFQ